MDMAALRGTLGDWRAPLGRSLWDPGGSQGGRFLTWGGPGPPVGPPRALMGGPRDPPRAEIHIKSMVFHYFSENE